MAYNDLNFVAGEVLTSTKMNALAMNDQYVKSEGERIDGEQKATANEVNTIKADIDAAADILDSILGENAGAGEGNEGGGEETPSGNTEETPVPPSDTPESENGNGNSDDTGEVVNG